MIGDFTFGIAPHGWGKYRFCLDHEMARIGFSTSRHLPTVRGPAPLPVFARRRTRGGGEVRARVPRCRSSPAAPVGQQGRPLRRLAGLVAGIRGRPALRLPSRRPTHLRGGRHPTGFEFGSRTTKTFLARLYDKTADMAAKDNGWWLEVWGEQYVPGPPVHRLEFEIGRQGLVEFDLNVPDQVLGSRSATCGPTPPGSG